MAFGSSDASDESLTLAGAGPAFSGDSRAASAAGEGGRTMAGDGLLGCGVPVAATEGVDRGVLGRGEMWIRGLGRTASSGLGSSGLGWGFVASGAGAGLSVLATGVGSAGSGSTSGVGPLDPNPPGIRLGEGVTATGVGSTSVGSASVGSARVGSASVGSGLGVGAADQPSGSGVSDATGVGSDGLGSVEAGATSTGAEGVAVVAGSGASTHPTHSASDVEPSQAAARVIPCGCRRGLIGDTGRPSLIDENERLSRP
jgi:hypothetical protein